MSDQTFAIDYSGARGSNTGDEFHELWATRQALRLLDTTTGLTAITVEGMTVAEGQDRVWDGVDCAAFYGGETAADAERVEFQQMKYSAADAARPWTVARFATGRGSKSSASPISRLAAGYQALIRAAAETAFVYGLNVLNARILEMNQHPRLVHRRRLERSRLSKLRPAGPPSIPPFPAWREHLANVEQMAYE